jgi:hypothetical protein
MKRRKKYNWLEALVTLAFLIITAIVKLVIRIILFVYDVITIYTSKYSVYVNIKLGQIDILKLGHFLPVQPFFCNP